MRSNRRSQGPTNRSADQADSVGGRDSHRGAATLSPETPVVFTASRRGTKMSGKVVNGRTINGEIEILIDGDPFPVMVARNQVTQTGGSETTMTTARQTT